MKAYYVDIYCNTIQNFPESILEKMDCNWCSIIVPEYILEKWYELHKERIHREVINELENGIFTKEERLQSVLHPLDFFMDQVYTCDMTEDLYSFCMTQKYLPGILL